MNLPRFYSNHLREIKCQMFFFLSVITLMDPYTMFLVLTWFNLSWCVVSDPSLYDIGRIKQTVTGKTFFINRLLPYNS